jgi:hypothetical protein
MDFSPLEFLLKAPSKKAVEDFLLACFKYRNTEFPVSHIKAVADAFQISDEETRQVSPSILPWLFSEQQ